MRKIKKVTANEVGWRNLINSHSAAYATKMFTAVFTKACQ
jgi:hypothetical protein